MTRSWLLLLNKHPVIFAFLASVLLSVVAILDREIISRDGAFYIYISQYASAHGFQAAFDLFNWPWYSMLIAAGNDISGLPHELVAYVLTVLFMAGTCALTVSIVDKIYPAARWWSVLLVLSIPVYNELRGEIIRESGFWFFVALSIWLVATKGAASWRVGLLFQASVVLACFFRLEAAFLVFAAGLYFLFIDRAAGLQQRLIKVVRFNSGFLLFFCSAFLYVVFFDAQLGSRIAYYSGVLDPLVFFASIEAISDQFAEVALRRWSHSDAAVIVVSGIIFALVWRTIVYTGVSAVLILYAAGRSELGRACSRFKLGVAAVGVYFIVLFVFFVQERFVNSRYMAVLLLMATPLLSIAVFEFSRKHEKAARFIMYVSLLFILANVISFGDKKTHYAQVADWVKNNTSAQDRILYDDPRIAYYAERPWPDNNLSFQQVVDQGRQDEYDYLMFELGKNRVPSEEVIAGFETLADFSNRKRTIYIVRKNDRI